MMVELYNPPLQVIQFVATRPGDAERGPEVRLRADEAGIRAVRDGELVWVYGPRRHDLATVRVDPSVPRGGIIARDISGVAASEIVRLVRVDDERTIMHTPPRP